MNQTAFCENSKKNPMTITRCSTCDFSLCLHAFEVIEVPLTANEIHLPKALPFLSNKHHLPFLVSNNQAEVFFPMVLWHNFTQPKRKWFHDPTKALFGLAYLN